MQLGEEKNEDYHKVYVLVKKAFEHVEHRDGKEQDLVCALRKSEAFIPSLSIVAELNHEVVGHILFTKIRIGEKTQVALAPLSVLPDYQRKGIGTALILAGHRIAKELVYQYSVVLGSEKYYPKFGYQKAEDSGIYPPRIVAANRHDKYRHCIWYLSAIHTAWQNPGFVPHATYLFPLPYRHHFVLYGACKRAENLICSEVWKTSVMR